MSFQVLRAGEQIGVYVDGHLTVKATTANAAVALAHDLLRAVGETCPCSNKQNPQQWDNNTGRWRVLNPSPPLQEWRGKDL